MFDTLEKLMILVPALPLAATLITAALGKHVLKERSHLPVVLALAASCVCSFMLLFEVRYRAESASGVGWEKTVDLWQWANIEGAIATPPAARMDATAPVSSALPRPPALNWQINVTLRADALTAMMLAMVTFISMLVAIYSRGYMHGDPGYWRFFTYIGLFVFSMTMLVSVSNFVLLYVFWEAVGACSYLLIGFWFEKPSAAAAAKKAFLVNRVGDFGFVLGLFLIWTIYGTLNFHDSGGIAGVLGQTRLAGAGLYVGGGVALAIALLLLVGACGKSAQFPLHIWLPDAMEGPTPVSALIHAATMVTAGVYMVTRCTPLFHAAGDARVPGLGITGFETVAVVGAITAALGGIIAMTQNDLKRVLAYSTISQLGYMFLGLGTGTLAGITAGMFHLLTHAFFKALLFLGAGSVMHAMGGVIDMRRFGGLRRIMPTTHFTFLIGALALAGVVPFAGFWSKDAILAAVHERAHEGPLYSGLYYVALAVAFLTAVYTFRAFFLTFYGEEHVPAEAAHHAQESPFSMTAPLAVLALGAIVVGAYYEWTHAFADFLHLTPSLSFGPLQPTDHPAAFHMDIAAISTVIALLGVAVAAFLYLGDRTQADWLARKLLPFYRLSHGRFFIDAIYSALVVWPLWLLGQLCYAFDRYIIDGLVNLAGKVPTTLGAALRRVQMGLVQFYALAMVLGVLVLIGTLLLWPSS